MDISARKLAAIAVFLALLLIATFGLLFFIPKESAGSPINRMVENILPDNLFSSPKSSLNSVFTNKDYRDVLKMEGWYKYSPAVELGKDKMIIKSTQDSSEIRVVNTNDFIDLGQKNCEIIVQMSAASLKDPNSKKMAAILIHNKSDSLAVGDVGLVQIGIDQNQLLFVTHYNPQGRTEYLITYRNNIKLANNKLRIDIERASDQENFNFFDGENGNFLTSAKLPYPLLAESGSRLHFGFYPQSGDLNGIIMTVDEFKVALK